MATGTLGQWWERRFGEDQAGVRPGAGRRRLTRGCSPSRSRVRLESLLKPENKERLANILKYHFIAGRIYSDAAVDGKEAKTLLGQNIRVSVGGSGPKVNDAALLTTDINAFNGVIHVIASVLLPQDKVSAHEARQMIEHAIARGSRLFNAGHHHECAQIHTETARKIVNYGDRMPTEVTCAVA
jgi:hypothetical protein